MVSIRQRQHKRAARHPSVARLTPSHRDGSTLLIVIVLMGMLTFLGVLFYMFAAQELRNAENYAEGAKIDTVGLDTDALMDFALKQLIEGPDVKYKNSALWGGRHCLLSNMLGRDVHPFDGAGVTSSNLITYVDFNDSPAANNGTERDLSTYPSSDVEYTYPDINNIFLHYEGIEPNSGRRIIIPSFHRPQYLRSGGAQIADWYTNTTMAGRVMRPHPSHTYVTPPGVSLSTTATRFLTDAQAAVLLGATYKGFPFNPDRDGNSIVDEGVWTVPWVNNNYEYDVDNDNDGIAEGVWMDLDFPVQEALDGTLFIPMVSFTIKDADGLLNPNVHGNLARVWTGDISLTTPFADSGSNPFISKSNLGLSPDEVNLSWALNRQPGTGAGTESNYPADTFFGGIPTDWREVANRELAFMLLGRMNVSPSLDLLPGRFGEQNLLYNAINSATGAPLVTQSRGFAYNISGSALANPWPGPGQTRTDDNGDFFGVWGGRTGQLLPAFVHPLDFLGIGSRVSGGPKAALMTGAGRARWPLYDAYSSSSGGTIGWTGVQNSVEDTLFNDMMEAVFDNAERRDEDNLFGADEMLGLQLSQADFIAAGIGETRLSRLAPYNIAPGTALRSPAFTDPRFKFTTVSWDRKEFGWGRDSTRTWEFNADADGDGKLEFPPQFPGVTAYDTIYPSVDPFRPVLRKLLEIEQGDRNGGRKQLRFSVNDLLTDSNGQPQPTIGTVLPPKIELALRPLTPHPDMVSLGATAITDFGADSYPAGGNFSGNYQLQEYWARRDRQLMARDIYVMLYTFGSPAGAPPIDPTIANPIDAMTGDGPVYTGLQLRRMAQFAVNLVDSLDRDNVMTRFEYDQNLGTGGWDMDDNSFTAAGTENERAEVWGIERLDLTISETLAVLTDQTSSDMSFTQWTDNAADPPYFMYVELRNPGPLNAVLNNHAWQIEVLPPASSPANPSVDEPKQRRLTLLTGTIAPGDTYTIGSASKSMGGMYPSVLKVGSDGTGASDWDAETDKWIVPPLGRPLDLDLMDAAMSTSFTLTDGAGTTPAIASLLESTTPSINAAEVLTVVLRRRAFPDRPTPATASEEADNPWVSVDSLTISDVKKLGLAPGDAAAAIQMKLADNTKSRERREPFAGTSGESDYDSTGTSANTQAYLVNTFEADNSKLDGNFTHWQIHFDRDYSSMAELLSIPVGSGRNAAQAAGDGYLSPQKQIEDDDIGSAASQFLIPKKLSDGTELNRWHRVLELMEVPTRAHANSPGFRHPLDYLRVPGKINLNTVRYPEVLASLIDDPTVIALDMSSLTQPRVNDQAGDVRGDYWAAFIRSRDGRRNSTTGTIEADSVTGMYLPGTTTSNPFRSLANVDVDTTVDGLENTVLRTWPEDPNMLGTDDPRMFFELGTATEHKDATSPIEPPVRNRILAKVLNNTTTRSNVFVAFVSIKFFRAVNDGGAIRIAKPLKLSTDPSYLEPEHRGFFVIDRSQPERAYDASTGKFDFRGLIEYRRILQ